MRLKETEAVQINLTQGKVALIDKEDFKLVSGFNWPASKMNVGIKETECRPTAPAQTR